MTNPSTDDPRDTDTPSFDWPDLPTEVGLPGYPIGSEVGGKICLNAILFSTPR